MNDKNKTHIVWSSAGGDQRKSKNSAENLPPVDPTRLLLKLRRLTAGKGRTVIEISDLPAHPPWCKDLALDLKKKLGCGGTYKQGMIEIHHNELSKVAEILEQKGLKWKKSGG